MGVSTDTWEEIPDRRRNEEQGLMLLSDAKRWVISKYGLRDNNPALDVAHPATFIIGRDGKVGWRSMPENWRHRPHPTDVLAIFGRTGDGEGAAVP